MSELNINPWNVPFIVSVCVFILLTVYVSRIKSKSTETKTMLAWLVSLVLFFGFQTTANIAANSGFDPDLFNLIWGIGGMFVGVLWILFAYQYGTISFVKEQKWVIRFLTPLALVLGFLAVSGSAEGGQIAGIGAQLMQAWGAIVFLRKWRIARRQEKTVYTSGYLVFPIFTLLPVLLGLSTIVLVEAGVAGIASFIGSFVETSLPIVVGLMFLQFTPEASSLEAKFIGVGLLVVIIAVQIRIGPFNTAPKLWETYASAPVDQSLLVKPNEEGGYTAQGISFDFREVAGELLVAADDTTIARAAPFPVTFYGVTSDSVWINSNGAIAVGALPDSADGGLSLYRMDVPAVAAFRTDLDASESGRIMYSASPDSIVVTWLDVPLFWDQVADGRWPAEERSFSSQIVLKRDGSMVLSRRNVGVRPPAWEAGLTPGSIQESFAGVRVEPWSGREGVLAEGRQFPVSVTALEMLWVGESNLRQRFDFQQDQSRQAIRFAFLLMLAVLVLVPLYFRYSLKSRLGQLMTALGRVQSGDLNADVKVTVRDEVGRMSESFNAMTASLRDYAHNMEDLVEERTAELKATQAQLVEQEKLASLGSLTAGIAHEIKNPLNFVNNFAEVGGELADELDEAIEAGRTEEARSILAEMKANSEQITKHGKRADSIVKSMMQHARGGASDRESIVVNDFLEEYANLAWHGRRAKDDGFQAELKRDFSPDAGSLNVMPQELGRVVLNLLNNAFDAVRGVEGAEVTASTRKSKGSNSMDYIEISVSDNGPGIPDDIREKIFEPFFTTKATGEGTGLGLSLSYDIVTKGHGGTMTVGRSSEGGALFQVQLPANL